MFPPVAIVLIRQLLPPESEVDSTVHPPSTLGVESIGAQNHPRLLVAVNNSHVAQGD